MHPPQKLHIRYNMGANMGYIVFGNDERMSETRKLLAVEKTADVICVFSPSLTVITEDTRKIPWGSKAYLANKSVETFRYGDFPDFKEVNSRLTAEAVIAILLSKSKKLLADEKILVVGYGGCGRETVKYLDALKCDCTVMTSRPEKVRERADTVGYDAPVSDFDFIVNTAPSRIISNEKLLTLKTGAEIIDIASAPYGIDHDFAEKNGIAHGIYPCLPVRYKSAAAGQAIVNLVRREYDETGGCRDRQFLHFF